MVSDVVIRRLGPGDLDLLCATPADVFDNPVDRTQAAAFLADDLHEIVMAYVDGVAVGMTTGTVLLHPDKPPQLFIAEVGVAEAFQRRGIGKRLMQVMFDIAQQRGCTYLWLGTECDNTPARALYRSLQGDETEGLVIYEWENTPDAS